LNIELDKFVYSSSHDLMAPLRSILGLINLCHLSEDPEETKKYLSMIKGRVSELEKFIKEMSDYSKNARQAIVVEEIEIKRLLRDVLETLRFYPHAERLLVDIDVQDELKIFSDHTRLKVIFSNIISNCFKYCDLSKKESFVRISASRIPGMIYVEIEDNGVGIKESALPKIFDMFYRAHDHGEGTGLGLYIVKEAIDKVGGTIAVHSHVGKGTTFKITLPTKINS
jgi:signal transduction histidine kinase